MYKGGRNQSIQHKFTEKCVWERLPDASKAPENIPNHKGCQKFMFMKPWEPKHAIGKLHAKRLEFEKIEGVGCIDWASQQGYFGCFVIQGKPDGVDKAMLEIGIWLDKCLEMHHDDLLW